MELVELFEVEVSSMLSSFEVFLAVHLAGVDSLWNFFLHSI